MPVFRAILHFGVMVNDFSFYLFFCSLNRASSSKLKKKSIRVEFKVGNTTGLNKTGSEVNDVMSSLDTTH